MVKNKQVVIVGGGNVARALGERWQKAGFSVTFCLRREKSAYLWLEETAADYLPVADLPQTMASLIIIAVSDAAIPEVAARLQDYAGLVAHTAGSVSIESISKYCRRSAVLYPLQSLRPATAAGVPIPCLLEVAHQVDKTELAAWAGGISDQLYWVNSDQRLQMHVNAVLVSNFTNHLYQQAALRMENGQLDFAMLQPLIEETALRLRQAPPQEWLTGPAVRNDRVTLALHESLLTADPQLLSLYRQLTQSIQLLNTNNG